ncbi:MAG: UrcA family protein [Pseudomonadota bacterium]
MSQMKDICSNTVRLAVRSGALMAVAMVTAPALLAQDTVVEGKAQRSDVVEQRVGYSDLDLTNHQNQLILVSRVKKAVNKVCDILYSGHSPLMKFESGCMQTVYRNTKPQIALAIANADSGTRVAIRISPPRSH